MNILFFPHVKKKAQYYLRYLWPAQELAKHGYNVKVKDPELHNRWYEQPELMVHDMAWADVIVCFYPKTRSGVTLVDVAEKFGRKVVSDLDDYVFAVDPSNPAYAFSGTQDVMKGDKVVWQSGVHYNPIITNANHQRFLYALQKSACMTVTTPTLSDFYAPFVDDIWVLPNSLNLDVYKPWKRRHPEDQIRIGWQGGASHVRDMQMFAPAITEILNKYPNVTFVGFGSYSNTYKDMPEGRVEYHPWVDSEAYPLKLGSLDLDIGVCPIIDSIFSQCKSNLKQVEYGAFGIPSVCSHIPNGPYNDPVTVDGVDGMLVKDNDLNEWVSKLSYLIENPKERKEMGRLYAEKVKQAYNIKETWKYWANCYETVGTRLLADAG